MAKLPDERGDQFWEDVRHLRVEIDEAWDTWYADEVASVERFSDIADRLRRACDRALG